MLHYAGTFKQPHPLMTLKSLICFVCLLGASLSAVNAQTVVITDDATYTVGEASSVLDVKSTTKGFLVPRMTTVQRTAVASPADGLLVYQTDGVKGFYNYNTTTSAWVSLGSASGGSWTVTGNTGLVAANFLGTTDLTSMRFRTNNAFRMVIDSIGSVGIGSINFNATNREKLLIDAGVTTSVTALYAVGSINNYLQLNVRNLSNGTGASSDLVATADNGSETTNYVNLGINSSGYTPNATGKPDDGYLLSNGNDFYLENLNTAKDVIFSTGTGTAERMRLTSAGYLGIGTSAPLTALHVYGVNPLTLRGVQLGGNTDSLLTISSGTVRKIAFGSAFGASWSSVGNTGTSYPTNFLGTTDKKGFRLRTNNTQRMMIDSIGHMAVGLNSNKAPLTVPLTVKDTIEIRRTVGTGNVATLLFNTTAATSTGLGGSGDIRMATDDFGSFWQGGIGRYLTMGSYWPTIICGDREVNSPMSFVTATQAANLPGTGTIIQSMRDISVSLGVQSNSPSATANLQEWRNYNGTQVYSFIDNVGNYAGPSAFLTSTAAAAVPLTITGIASQTGDLIEFKNSGGTVLSAINAAGNFTGTAAGASGTGSFGTIPTGKTAVTNIFRTTFSSGTDNTVMSQNGQHAYSNSVAGITSNPTFIITPQTALPTGLLIGYAYYVTTGTLLNVVIFNTSATAQGLPNNTLFNVTVIQ